MTDTDINNMEQVAEDEKGTNQSKLTLGCSYNL